MRRKPGSERGAGEFEPISWDEALSTLTERLARIRATDPRQLAFFTDPPPDPMMEELRTIDVNALTPLEALNRLAELKRRAEDRR